MKLTYDIITNEMMAGEETLREFYIRTRKESGISIGKLQRDCGVSHPTLANIETANKAGKCSNAVKPILVALECLGYSLEING